MFRIRSEDVVDMLTLRLFGGGNDSGYTLGALALGARLKRMGEKIWPQIDLVLLYTNDIPERTLRILGHLWDLRLVEAVDAADRLFNTVGTRFDKAFTKLHALSLMEYEKVLALDLGIAVTGRLDHLFQMNPPVALHRRTSGNKHGAPIDGRRFFRGEGPNDYPWEWTQGSGINAGVLLLQPDEALYKYAMRQVQMKDHPAHVRGSGPEQDYLSRLLAPLWTHLGVAYNYQPHRVFHALEDVLELPRDSEQDYPERLQLSTEKYVLFIIVEIPKCGTQTYTICALLNT